VFFRMMNISEPLYLIFTRVFEKENAELDLRCYILFFCFSLLYLFEQIKSF